MDAKAMAGTWVPESEMHPICNIYGRRFYADGVEGVFYGTWPTPGGRKPGNVFWHFPPQPEGNEAALIEGRKGSARGGSPLDYITARVMAFFGI